MGFFRIGDSAGARAGEALERGLKTLEEGEEWLLKPETMDGNPCLWSPGIKLHVARGSWFHRNECFGPVLGVMRAENLEDAIGIQNDSEFGLTGGIHSLDEREVEVWKERVEVGNAYVNRPITGAIVRRQSFGGWKKSYFGPGAKAGGPNYVAQFGTWKNVARPERVAECRLPVLRKLRAALPAEAEMLGAIAGSDAFWIAEEFGKEHDHSGLRCEANVFRYRKFRKALIRVRETLSDLHAARLILAAEAVGMDYEISCETPREWMGNLGCGVVVETVGELRARISADLSGVDLLRAPRASAGLRKVANYGGIRVVDGPVVWNGRLELSAWYREQAVSETLHRYGNLVTKAGEGSKEI